MDTRDKLAAALDKLNDDQIRILTRLAEIIAEEQQADPLHDKVDIHVRYEQFAQWCAANNLDLTGVERWIQESRRAGGRPAASAPEQVTPPSR